MLRVATTVSEFRRVQRLQEVWDPQGMSPTMTVLTMFPLVIQLLAAPYRIGKARADATGGYC